MSLNRVGWFSSMIPLFDFRRVWARGQGLSLAFVFFSCFVSRGNCQQAFLVSPTLLVAQGICNPIERRVPPIGLEVPDEVAKKAQETINEIRQSLTALPAASQPDVEVLLKSCEYAIKFRELYKASDFRTLEEQLKLARSRLETAQEGRAPWAKISGLQVRGYQSSVDGSVQPIGLEFGSELNEGSKSVPLYVWLHGRGDKVTDLHFIRDRLSKRGKVVPSNAIVLHPFGRQCIGYKSAGEVDVMEAIDFVCQEYPVDRSRIVLMGFSMGGAGVWHLAAHYGERFIAASPGAGFAETAQYQRLKPEDYPAKHVQMLWGIYDVPGYVRNLFNIPVVAYSGENDKQIQAARVMEQAYESEGRKLPHLIGPGMGHKYHPDSLAEILRRMDHVVGETKSESEGQFSIQTKHWRYGSRNGIEIDGLAEPYQDTRVDAESRSRELVLDTKNVSRLRIEANAFPDASNLRIDGQSLKLDAKNKLFGKHSGRWTAVSEFGKLRKHKGLSGPIDDAFLSSFLVVLPSKKASSSEVENWIQCELELFKLRWESLFRGRLRVKKDVDVTAADMERFNLVCWGTPNSNTVLGAAFSKSRVGPIRWDSKGISVSGTDYSQATSVLAMIYPNPMQPNRYLVVNSGPTFRPAHDRTNSLQNPQLPDWVVFEALDTRNAEYAGEIAKCGFFDDSWQLNPRLTW